MTAVISDTVWLPPQLSLCCTIAAIELTKEVRSSSSGQLVGSNKEPIMVGSALPISVAANGNREASLDQGCRCLPSWVGGSTFRGRTWMEPTDY